MPRHTTAPALAGFALLALLLALAVYLSYRPLRPLCQQDLLERLRATLLSSPRLRQAHPALCHALEQATLVPLSFPEISYSEPEAQRIHLLVADPRGEAYDRHTLLHVLLHEATHAALHAEAPGEDAHLHHGEEFWSALTSALGALAEDGLVDPQAAPSWTYPAHLLEDLSAPDSAAAKSPEE